MTDKQRIDWLEKRNTLHDGTDFLYVVDGYEITVYNTRHGLSERVYHGMSVRDVIDEAIKQEELAK